MRTLRIDLKALASRSARVVALRRRLQSGEAQHWTTWFGASGTPPKSPSPPSPMGPPSPPPPSP